MKIVMYAIFEGVPSRDASVTPTLRYATPAKGKIGTCTLRVYQRLRRCAGRHILHSLPFFAAVSHDEDGETNTFWATENAPPEHFGQSGNSAVSH
jgi:hypothetical protein